MSDWQHLDQTYLFPTVRRLPVTIAAAENNWLIDTEGKRYLDLFTGLAVNILGHSHPHLMKALNEQGHRFLHISNLFSTRRPSVSLNGWFKTPSAPAGSILAIPEPKPLKQPSS